MTSCLCDLKPFEPFVQYGTGFRQGSIVCYKGRRRPVFKVFFGFQPTSISQSPAQRVVTHLDLGNVDTYVPIIEVRLIKI